MLRNNFKYWTIIILLSYGPTVGLHLIVRPMWFNGTDSITSATIIEGLITMLFLPIYLVVANYIAAKKHKRTNWLFFLNGIIIVTCILISTEIHFRNWLKSSGYKYADSGTKAVMDFERNIGIIVTLIGLAIIYFRIHNKNKTSLDNAIK